MVLIFNTFQSPASPTTLTTGNSGNADGSAAFSAISIAATGTLATDTAHPAFGPQGLKVATGGTAGLVYAEWLSVGPLNTGSATVWGCHYLYLTANPSSTWRFAQMLSSASGIHGAVGISTAGKLLGQDSSNTTQTPAFTATVPLNQLFRVEWKVISSATVGLIEVELFSTANDITPTETQASTPAQNTGSGAIGQTRLGQVNSVANTGPFYVGYSAFSDTGYPGPSNQAYSYLPRPLVVPSLRASVY